MYGADLQHGIDISNVLPTTPNGTLERRKRSMPPINRLPVEVLSMIFECLSCMDGIYVFRSGSRSHSIDIMRVCKFWTDIAIHTASVWQKIAVRTTGDWLAVALPRSKGMPLDVTVYDASRILDTIAPLLTKEAPRLRTLKVNGADNVIDLLENTILAVDQLLCLDTLLFRILHRFRGSRA